MGSHTVILNTRRVFFCFFRRNCPHSTDCSCHCWSRQIRPHILCIWDGIVSLWPPLRSPTATLAGGCKKTIRIQIIPGPERSWRGRKEDVEGDEVRERRIRCCSLSVQRPPACTHELSTHTHTHTHTYIYIYIYAARSQTLCSNVAFLIHRSQSISTWQVLKYNIENSTSPPVLLLHLNCSLTAEEGGKEGRCIWRCLDWPWHGAPTEGQEIRLHTLTAKNLCFIQLFLWSVESRKSLKGFFKIPVLLF